MAWVSQMRKPRDRPGTSRVGDIADKSPGRDTTATAELLSEATSLLKTLQSMKVLRVKELRPKGADSGGAVGLLDGGATNRLREARRHELPHLVPVRVELASGSVTLFKVKEHAQHPLVAGTCGGHCAAPSAREAWIKISHPEYGRVDCTLRRGCPLLPERQALARLRVMEKSDRGELLMNEEIQQWWSSRFPEVPNETWNYMNGQLNFDPETCPRNRHQWG